ncbi:MAG: CHAD domain-containing protein [Acidimicrobiales bacterium]
MVTFTSADAAAEDVGTTLAGAGFDVGPVRPLRRTVLDTFDGRVAAAGWQLELREHPHRQLVLTAPGSAPAALPVETTPRFATDLPSGPFRARLAPVLEVRALSPVLTLEGRHAQAVRRNRDGKVLVQLDLHLQVRVEGHDGVAPLWGIDVSELAGYAKEGARARALLAGLGLGAAADIVTAAAAAAGIDLSGAHSSPTVPLTAAGPALAAYRRVLANLAGTVEANHQGTVEDVDPEFLHDLRVAVRRTRSVLAQSKGVLPAAVRDQYRQSFRWLGEITGPARDLDVYVIEWDGYVAPLGPVGAADLAPVLAHVGRRRQAAHTALAKGLRSTRYRALMAAWTAWVRGDEPEGGGDDAVRPIGQVAAARTARAHKRLLRRGRSITPDSPAEDLHELRKDAKRLRYLLECFGSLYDGGARKAFVQRLKALQDNLGTHQDAEVHVSQLRAFSDELHGKRGLAAATLIAMGQLAEHLDRRRRAAREEFAGRFAAYDTKQTARTFNALLRSAGGGG